MSRAVPVTLDIKDVVVLGDNVRQELGDIAELKTSIKTIGLLQPLVVTKGPGKRYTLVCGHRRLEACKQVGRVEVPAFVVEVHDEAERLAVMLAENTARRSLTALEIARACDKLIADHGVSQKEVAELIGYSAPHVSMCLRLLELPDRIQQLVHRGEMGLQAALGKHVWEKQERRRDLGTDRGWHAQTKLGYIKAVSVLLDTQGPGGVRHDQPEVITALADLMVAIAGNPLVAEELERREKGAA